MRCLIVIITTRRALIGTMNQISVETGAPVGSGRGLRGLVRNESPSAGTGTGSCLTVEGQEVNFFEEAGHK
jgi:hypothetical protein